MNFLAVLHCVILISVCEIFEGHRTNAGMCWLQQGPAHRCDMVLMRGVSREECCAAGRLDTAWSNTSLPINEVSLLGFLGIVSCKPCKAHNCATNCSFVAFNAYLLALR
uniref:Follistatin-related protein 3-like n=1 Tax=Sinocyclocheilus grahami TaxID=75366 RepID=A0A672SIS6_SINGR